MGTSPSGQPPTAGSEPSEPEEPDSPWLTLTSNAVQALRRHVEHVFGAGLREEIFVPLSRATKEGADVLGFWREMGGWISKKVDFSYWFDLIFVFFLAWKRCFFGGKPEERKFVGLLIRKYKSLVWDDSKSIHTSAGVPYLFWFVFFIIFVGGETRSTTGLVTKCCCFFMFAFLQSSWPPKRLGMLVLLQASIYEIWAHGLGTCTLGNLIFGPLLMVFLSHLSPHSCES